MSTYKIRPLEASDIEEVAELSNRHFPENQRITFSELTHQLRQQFINGPSVNSECPSLVALSKTGKLCSFLAVSIRTYLFDGQEIKVGYCSNFMADDKARAALVPFRMLKIFLDGPQDFSYTDDSVDASRLLWNRMGGQTSGVNSIYYKIPLRPFSFAARPISKNLSRPTKVALKQIAYTADAVGGTIKVPWFYRKPSDATFTKLNSDLYLKGFERLASTYTFYPKFTIDHLDRVFDLLNQQTQYGELQKIAYLDRDEKLKGWFIYYAKKGSVCEVLQAVSVSGKVSELYKALTYHAYCKGGIELSGQLPPVYIGTVFSMNSICIPGRMWTLIHSSSKELLYEVETSKAFLSRI